MTLQEGVPSAPKFSKGKTILFAALVFFCFLVFLEIGWRFYLQYNGRGFFDDPEEFTSVFFTTDEEPRPKITPYAYGYYRSFVLAKKETNEIRVICFGGSTTVNRRAGISYTDLLESYFADKTGPYKVRFLNAGGDGYSTAHVLVNFSLRNLEVQPDIITLFENINDCSSIAFGTGVTTDYSNKYKTDFFLAYRHRTGLIAQLSKLSRVFRALAFSIARVRYPPMEVVSWDRDYSQGLKYYLRNLRSIVAIARANEIGVLLASQPGRSDMREFKVFNAFNDAAKNFAQQERLPFVDLAAVVRDDRLFVDANHNNREGVELVAEQLRAPLADLIEEVRKKRETADSRNPPK